MRTKPKAVACFLWCFAFGLTQQASGELVVAEGLAVELFATTGQLSHPASIDIDHRGRVWVGEAVNYRKKDRKGGDRILILEDSDGDGRADKTKVFYQDPDIDGVHGVCVLGNQAIVSAPDRILLLTDTDGDDQADEKKLLFKGKVLRPVHGQHDHAIHAVMFGPDGRLYFNFGNYSAGLWRADGSLAKDAFGNPVNNSRKPFQEGMVIRCEMDGSKVEVLGHNFRNNWEVAVDSFGSMWQSDNDNGSSSCRVNFVMEYGNYGYRDEKTGADYKTNRTNMEATMQRRMWHQMLLSGGEYGGVRYLSEKSVRELTRKQTGDVKPAGHGAGNFHALAFQEAVEPQGPTAALTKASFGKGGSGGSLTWVDPSTKTIYIMLQNAWGGNKNLTHSTFLNSASNAIPSK